MSSPLPPPQPRTPADGGSELSAYARQTAADTGTDYASAVRAMDDEPGEVARETGLTVSEVQAWCDGELTPRDEGTDTDETNIFAPR